MTLCLFFIILILIIIVMFRFALRSSQRKPRSPRLEPRGGQGGKPKVILMMRKRRILKMRMLIFLMMRIRMVWTRLGLMFEVRGMVSDMYMDMDMDMDMTNMI